MCCSTMVTGLLIAVSVGQPVGATSPGTSIKELKLRDWQPRSMMVTKVTPVDKPAFPVIDARISELGRQPYSARRFILKYQDRIMFGTDTTPRADAYRMYYRFLETDDEYFDPAQGHHRQGFWPIYGIFLPQDVLQKLYRGNAQRILYWGKP